MEIKDMSKKQLIENIVQALIVIRNRRGIKGDSKKLLKEFLWKLRQTREYREFNFEIKKDEKQSWSIHDPMPDFSEENEVDKLCKSYLAGK